jgi:RNA polymerase sigma-70 factor (ECF subfamily)
VNARPGHEALVAAHYERLRRLSELLLGDRHEAEEVVQDVFTKVCEVGERAAIPLAWGPWLTRVTVNACRDRRKAGWWMRFRLRSHRVEDMALPSPEPNPSEASIRDETRRRIWRAFRSLPDRQREVFVLRYVEEYPTDQVATTLGIHPGTVKRHLFRAIRRMREALEDAQ